MGNLDGVWPVSVRAGRFEDRRELLKCWLGQERRQARVADQPCAGRFVAVEVGAEGRLGVVDVEAPQPVDR